MSYATSRNSRPTQSQPNGDRHAVAHASTSQPARNVRHNDRAGIATCSCGSTRFGSRATREAWAATHTCAPPLSTTTRDAREAIEDNASAYRSMRGGL